MDPTRLPVPLYHGTSTLFVDGIINSGLGGCNPLVQWKVLEFAKRIHPLVVQQLSDEDDWMVKVQSFGWMVDQKSAAMNFQHGDTYLSPVRGTAIRYAANKRFGSELLTYTLDFLQELLRRKIPGVADDLYHEYPHIFGLLDISCAPLLVKVDEPSLDELLAENGGDAKPTLDYILATLRENSTSAETQLQQRNFRLRRAIPVARLMFWLVNVTRWNNFVPEYSLHLLHIDGQGNDAYRTQM